MQELLAPCDPVAIPLCFAYLYQAHCNNLEAKDTLDGGMSAPCSVAQLLYIWQLISVLSAKVAVFMSQRSELTLLIHDSVSSVTPTQFIMGEHCKLEGVHVQVRSELLAEGCL